MIDEDKIIPRYNTRLNFFQNATEDELEKCLNPIEELDATNGFSVSDYTSSPFSGFHPKAVRMILKSDDYYLGSRADHFVLIFGVSEALDLELSDFSSTWDECVVCLANHKGAMQIKVFTFDDLKINI